MFLTCVLVVVTVALPLLAAAQVNTGTLETVRSRGVLLCGVNEGLPGFSISNADGEWSGIDVDLCRAVAAAALGDANVVTFIPLTARDRFPALRAGEVDVLVRNPTWTLARDARLAVDFAGVNYYDGQAFMTRAATGFDSVLDLHGAKVCVTRNTTTELNLVDYFRTHDMTFEPVTFVRSQEMFPAYDAGLCDVLTADPSSLSAHRPKLARAGDHVILPEVISKEPLGPAVRHGDNGWSDIVRWSLYAMIAAEEYGCLRRMCNAFAVHPPVPKSGGCSVSKKALVKCLVCPPIGDIRSCCKWAVTVRASSAISERTLPSSSRGG